MKPLNLDNSPCSPVSSNCVIWQGPNIDCISLCTGDSISTVIYNLATELCTIMNQLDLTNLDLACLNVGTNPPDTFSELIQLLINKICNTPTSSNLPAALTDPCPTNCIVPIAECFQSGTQTTMLLLDYVQMIGEKVCSLVDQIGTINTSITNIENRVTILENKPVPTPYTLPSFIVNCTLDDGVVNGGSSYDLEAILKALVNDDTHGYCALLNALGQPGAVTTAYQFQSTSVNNYVGTTGASVSLYNCGTPLQTEYNGLWVTNPLSLSDSFKNLWITVSDIRKANKTYAVVAGSNTTVTSATTATPCGNKDTFTVTAKGVTVTDSNSVDLTLTTVGNDWNIKAQVVDTGWVNLNGFSFYTGTSAAEYQPKCRRVGNMIYFRGMVMIPLSSAGNGTGTAVPWDYTSSSDTYATNTTVTPLTAPGSSDPNACLVDNDGSLQFNRGASVIPASVVDGGLPFENLIQTNYITAQRYARDSAGNSFILTSVLKIWITKDKRLVLQYLRDNEYSSGGIATNYFYSSPYNILNTIITANQKIADWSYGGISATSQPASALYPLQAYARTTLATFSCDPSQPVQTGGFGWMSLDGLVASVAPCNTDNKGNVCP